LEKLKGQVDRLTADNRSLKEKVSNFFLNHILYNPI